MSKPVLLWDVLDTLVYDPFYEEIPAFFGMTLDELIEAKHPTAWIQFEKGLIDEERFLDIFFEDGRDYDREGFLATVESAWRWLDGMESLLADLSRDGFEMHALSNYPIWYERLEEKLTLSRFLTWRFVSCRTGYRKPGPETYEHVLDVLGRAPEDCLFIDDRPRNTAAAAALGIQTIRFQGYDPLKSQLKAHV